MTGHAHRFRGSPSPVHAPPLRPDRRRSRRCSRSASRRSPGARPRSTVPKPAVLTFTVAKVGKPGNPSVGIVPFTNAIYPNCAAAPAEPTVGGTKLPDPCQEVGGVPYEYGIGKGEVTVEQYVAFLNTVDPFGRNQWASTRTNESGAAWPRFGRSTTPRWRGPVSTTPPRRRNGTTSPTASPTSSAPPASTTPSPTARCSRSRAPAPTASTTSPTRCGSPGAPRPGCTTCTNGPRCGPKRRASSSPARTSGSRPPTTTRTAAAPTPTGSTRPTKANSARSPRRTPRRPRRAS